MVSKKEKLLTFQNTILNLQNYWNKYGCIILQPYDLEVGAGTFHPATTLRSLGSKNPDDLLMEDMEKILIDYNTIINFKQ